MTKIAMVDYGAGNLFSLKNALEALEMEVIVTNQGKDLEACDAIVLPGVGAFADAMTFLNERDLTPAIQAQAAMGKAIIGICLGMQILFDRGVEGGLTQGLGLLPGEVVELPPGLKTPHMGWNQLQFTQPHHGAVKNLQEGTPVYFVHSYYLQGHRQEDVIAVADYGTVIPAIVGREKIIGLQFHPEKSGTDGLKILENLKGLIG